MLLTQVKPRGFGIIALSMYVVGGLRAATVLALQRSAGKASLTSAIAAEAEAYSEKESQYDRNEDRDQDHICGRVVGGLVSRCSRGL